MLDEVADDRKEGGSIVIDPVRPRGYDPAELLAGSTPGNLHKEVDFGGPLGKGALRWFGVILLLAPGGD
jgi:antitoxin MazE